MALTPITADTTPPCQACEALLPDLLDQILSPADQAWFDSHLAACAACSNMVADAQRGAAWLEILKTPRPEPSSALLSRILAQTSGQQHVTHLVTTSGPERLIPATWQVPAFPQPAANVLPFRPNFFSPAARVMETRLAMTAAMAFFSIAVTLSLTGVRLDQLHASSLEPSNLRNTWYQATAQAHRSYDNSRVVRVLTARVDLVRENLRAQPEENTAPAKPQGSTRLTSANKQGGLA